MYRGQSSEQKKVSQDICQIRLNQLKIALPVHNFILIYITNEQVLLRHDNKNTYLVSNKNTGQLVQHRHQQNKHKKKNRDSAMTITKR